jgi:hypothetical protein
MQRRRQRSAHRRMAHRAAKPCGKPRRGADSRRAARARDASATGQCGRSLPRGGRKHPSVQRQTLRDRPGLPTPLRRAWVIHHAKAIRISVPTALRALRSRGRRPTRQPAREFLVCRWGGCARGRQGGCDRSMVWVTHPTSCHTPLRLETATPASIPLGASTPRSLSRRARARDDWGWMRWGRRCVQNHPLWAAMCCTESAVRRGPIARSAGGGQLGG